MTRFGRILNVIAAIITIAFAVLLFYLDAIHGIKLILIVIQTTMSLRGLQAIAYYLSMGRHMVGGQNVLYRGMIFLDLGMFTSSIADNPAGFLIAYIAAVDAFTGLVSILHSLEAKRNGSLKWKNDFIFGLVSVFLAVIVLIGGFVLKRPYVSVCAYAFGLIYSSVMQITSAFRRNAIVYIA